MGTNGWSVVRTEIDSRRNKFNRRYYPFTIACSDLCTNSRLIKICCYQVNESKVDSLKIKEYLHLCLFGTNIIC